MLRIALVLHLLPFNVLYHASAVTCHKRDDAIAAVQGLSRARLSQQSIEIPHALFQPGVCQEIPMWSWIKTRVATLPPRVAMAAGQSKRHAKWPGEL